MCKRLTSRDIFGLFSFEDMPQNNNSQNFGRGEGAERGGGSGRGKIENNKKRLAIAQVEKVDDDVRYFMLCRSNDCF